MGEECSELVQFVGVVVGVEHTNNWDFLGNAINLSLNFKNFSKLLKK